MNCQNCGSYVPENAKYCTNCGSEIKAEEAFAPNTAPDYGNNAAYGNQPPQAQPYNNYYQQPYQQSGYTPSSPETSDINTAKIFGIISIVAAVLGFHIVGIILGAIGISSMNKIPAVSPNAFSAAESKKLCKIGLILCIVFAVLTVVLFVAFFALTMVGVSSGVFEDVMESMPYIDM